MIDSLIRILEKLTELLQKRGRDREKYFAKAIAPLFKDLQVVHENYLRMFMRCANGLRDGKNLRSVANSLAKDGIQREATRRSIVAFAEVSAKNRPRKFRPFLSSVLEYFHSGDLDDGSTWSLDVLIHLEVWAQKEAPQRLLPEPLMEEEVRRALSQHIVATLEKIRASWTRVCRLYAEL